MIKFKGTLKVEFMNSVIRNFTKEDCQRDLIVLHYILVYNNHVEQYPGTNTTNHLQDYQIIQHHLFFHHRQSVPLHLNLQILLSLSGSINISFNYSVGVYINTMNTTFYY